MTIANEKEKYRIMLFVAGSEPNSRRAKENLVRLCETELEADYELVVVDVLEDHQAAIDHHVMVVPMTVVSDSAPSVSILGDLSDTGRLRAALGLE